MGEWHPIVRASFEDLVSVLVIVGIIIANIARFARRKARPQGETPPAGPTPMAPPVGDAEEQLRRFLEELAGRGSAPSEASPAPPLPAPPRSATPRPPTVPRPAAPRPPAPVQPSAPPARPPAAPARPARAPRPPPPLAVPLPAAALRAVRAADADLRPADGFEPRRPHRALESLRRRDALRDAIIQREVLGPPLGLRGVVR